MNNFAMVLSAILGRDVSQELQLMEQARSALAGSLSWDQQLFVSANWLTLADWLKSDSGKESARLIVEEWRAWGDATEKHASGSPAMKE